MARTWIPNFDISVRHRLPWLKRGGESFGGPARFRAFDFGWSAALCLITQLHAADVDLTKLPPPVDRPIDFKTDIKPIFEASCLRCHGTEKPKSKFSLATRESALKGGENGVAILPRDSARSPLIHYVAGLVEDMQMPPPGKADPLTREQIAFLRAWIDQGVVWEAIDLTAQYRTQFSFTPAVRWVTVSGNAHKFQEHQWIRRGTTAGASDFRLAQKLTNGVAVVAAGHALTDDYRITLDVQKDGVGYARFGFEQGRHYYDDRGPYYPFRASGFTTPTAKSFDLHRELYLDTGKATAEIGWTGVDRLSVVLGYEYQFKDGRKSLEEWGPVSQARSGTNDLVRNIFPAYKEVKEEVHIVKLDVAYDTGDVRIEDNARVEFSSLRTRRVSDTAFPAGAVSPAAFAITRETQDQLVFANTVRAEKPVRDWLFLSAGYLFSRLDADATLFQNTADGAGRPAMGTYWSGSDIVLEQDSHVFNVNALGGPWRGFTAALGVQNEWTSQRGFGDLNLREGDPNDPTVGLFNDAGFIRNDTDRLSVDETLILRYNAIPFTSLFADARLKQERIGQFETETDTFHEFLRDTDAANDWQDYKAGFNISPTRYAALNASYNYRLHQSEFDHRRDESPIGTPGEGYSAFIRSRDSATDAVDARLVLKPAVWIKGTLSYRFATTDYRTRTDATTIPDLSTPGGRIFAGRHDASILSANLTVTPWRRLFLSTTISYSESEIAARDNGSGAVAPYRGDLWSVLNSITFALNPKTDLTANYSWSQAHYGQGNAAGGLPLGIDYSLHGVTAGVRHSCSDRVMVALQYGFFDYDEPTAGGFANYTAHTVFATISFKCP